MDKKAIIACIAALAALAVLVAAAVFFLYSGTDETKTSAFASEGSTGLLAAVPSDAVMVAGFSDMKSACSLLTDTSGCFHYFTGGKESSLLLKFLEKAEGTDHGVLKSSRAVLSLHYNGSLVPLLVIDAGRASSLADGKAAGLIARADSAGLSVLLPDCQKTADENTYLHRRDIILLSTSDVQTKSAERHIAKGISVLDSEGFADCLRQAGEVGNTVFLSCGEAGKFFAGIARKGLSGYADFLKKFAGWASFSIDDAASDHLRLSGRFTSDSGAEDFINVFRGYSPARSSVGTVLPSYTVFFASLPLDDVSSYITCADAFADGTGKLGKTELSRKQLQKHSGLSPVQWARTLDVKEVAAAFFKVGGKIENLVTQFFPAIGMGHVFRALMLAHEITDHKITFVCTRESELAVESIARRDYRMVRQGGEDLADTVLRLRPDLVINDMLNTEPAYMERLRESGCRIVNFEDDGPGAKLAHLVINALYEHGDPDDPRVCCGPDYLLTW